MSFRTAHLFLLCCVAAGGCAADQRGRLENATTTIDVIIKWRERQPRPVEYQPPSGNDIRAAEVALGAPLPADFIEFLTKGHDLDVWTYKVKPNGHWDSARHDIVEKNLWFRKSRTVDFSRLLVFRATGGDGGYDAFVLPSTPIAVPATYPVVHFTYTDTGIDITPLADSFTAWLQLQLNEPPVSRRAWTD